jgi:hypothetical protein
VAGSGWRGGVSVEGGSGGVVASSGAVLLLDAEARERIVGATSERRRKHSAGEKNPTGGGRSLLRGGGRESGDAWGIAREREGGLGVAENGSGGWHRPPDGGHGRRRCHSTAAGSGTRATDKRDRATAGPGGKRRGVGQARPCDAALTLGSVAQCARVNSI